MTTTNVKCLQSSDIDAIDDGEFCIVINGSSTHDLSIPGEGAADAVEYAEESGAYGCEVMTVGEWARTCPEKQAYVLEDRGAKDGPVWWLSEVAVTFAVDEENNGETWWDAAREADVPECLAEVIDGDEDKVTLTGEDAVKALAWCQSLPGWNDGPGYALHPLATR